MHTLRVLTWHVHGNYLLYLSRANVEFVLPVDPGRGPGYGGRGTTFPFGSNVVEVPADEIRREKLIRGVAKLRTGRGIPARLLIFGGETRTPDPR
jgi:hypothetical protein